jgi:copper chaperone NosL
MGMKKILVISLVLCMLAGIGPAIGGEADDIAKFPQCFYCGMDRTKFAHSRMLVKYDDGSALGTCSIHCAALDMALFLEKAPNEISVGDYQTKKLIDAEEAYWVIGGDQMGVMTKQAKWAFEKKSDADQFIKTHGGRHATFEEAIETAYADMYKDTQMIREKRKMMKEKMKKKQ